MDVNYVWGFLHPMGDFTQLPHPPPPHKVETAVDKAYSSISNDMEKHTTNLKINYAAQEGVQEEKSNSEERETVLQRREVRFGSPER